MRRPGCSLAAAPEASTASANRVAVSRSDLTPVRAVGEGARLLRRDGRESSAHGRPGTEADRTRPRAWDGARRVRAREPKPGRGRSPAFPGGAAKSSTRGTLCVRRGFGSGLETASCGGQTNPCHAPMVAQPVPRLAVMFVAEHHLTSVQALSTASPLPGGDGGRDRGSGEAARRDQARRRATLDVDLRAPARNSWKSSFLPGLRTRDGQAARPQGLEQGGQLLGLLQIPSLLRNPPVR